MVAAVARRAAGNNAVAVDGEEELNGDGEEIVDVADEEVPLAALAPEADGTEDEAELTVVTDEEVPLSNLDIEQEKSRMSWWWLLIVAICGATGYEMYRKHKKNLAQEEEK